jgi:hypothetical protein
MPWYPLDQDLMVFPAYAVIHSVAPSISVVMHAGRDKRKISISCRKRHRSRKSRRRQNEIYMHRIVRKTKPCLVSLDQPRGQQ